ncbi:MAG: response regulator transcription factor [Oscillospiraceae bacterium]|jgi:two-component system KDP operon response regulator KdpE|nr:response regulator transcription factor [Oscillospiraceae bacterium]
MGQFSERVLVVEDDRQISSFICYALKNEGFSCSAAYTGQEALSRLVSASADILLLDLGLPDMDGLDIITNVREWSEMPIIIVSARDRDMEKAKALDCGADDYLTKPFSATELTARVRVAARHLSKLGGGAPQASRSVGGLQIHFDRRLVYLDGEVLHTTPMEYSLLSLLFKNIGKVLTSGHIIREVWGAGYGTDTQALRALMAGLRRKIEKVPATPRYIITETGIGYRLVDE